MRAPPLGQTGPRAAALPGGGRGRSGAGFTLIELLVVLVIVGLVMALAPPLFHAAVPSVRLKATARDLVASLRLARDLAVSRNTTSELVVDLRQRRYRVTGVARERQLPADVRVTFFPAGGRRDPLAGPVVRFFQDGTSSGGGFRLVTGDNVYLVEVDRLRGRVTLRAPEDRRS